MMKCYYRNCTFVREESEVEGFASIFDQSVPSRGRECVQSPFYHRQSLVMRIIIIIVIIVIITIRPWAAFDRRAGERIIRYSNSSIHIRIRQLFSNRFDGNFS